MGVYLRRLGRLVSDRQSVAADQVDEPTDKSINLLYKRTVA